MNVLEMAREIPPLSVPGCGVAFDSEEASQSHDECGIRLARC
jgi:hypothetical protein